jgi:hypothetical protein
MYDVANHVKDAISKLEIVNSQSDAVTDALVAAEKESLRLEREWHKIADPFTERNLHRFSHLFTPKTDLISLICIDSSTDERWDADEKPLIPGEPALFFEISDIDGNSEAWVYIPLRQAREWE